MKTNCKRIYRGKLASGVSEALQPAGAQQTPRKTWKRALNRCILCSLYAYVKRNCMHRKAYQIHFST